MLLDYSVPDFELLINGTDYADLVVSLTVSHALSEPERSIIWEGDFELAYTLEAQRGGLTEDDLNEKLTPAVWRPFLAPVLLRINSTTVLAMRIENYRWNIAEKKGIGKLTQKLSKLDRTVPGIAALVPGENIPTANVVNRLLGADSVITAGLIAGTMNVPLTSTQPLNDAQAIAAAYWGWIYTNTSEQYDVRGRGGFVPPVFVRSLKQVELEPNPDAINFVAAETIATGLKQEAEPYKTERERQLEREQGEPSTTSPEGIRRENPRPTTTRRRGITASSPSSISEDLGDRNLNTDGEGRSRKVITETSKPIGLVFPQLGTSTTAIVAERKTIYYLYLDGFDSSLIGLPQEILFKANGLRLPTTEWTDVVATLTYYERPAGLTFPQLGTNANLRFAEAVLESYQSKTIWKPAGVLFPQLGTNFNARQESDELITEGTLIRNRNNTLDDRDPITGQRRELEPIPLREPRQPIPELSINREPVRGRSLLNPSSGPSNNNTNVIRMQYTPDAERAAAFASEFAKREFQRRDSVTVTMPLPPEYVANLFQPFTVCAIHDAVYIIDNPVIDIGDKQCTFTFQGDYVGSFPVIPDPVSPQPIAPAAANALFIKPVAGVFGVVGSAIASVTLTAINGTAPYTWSGTLAPGLSLSSSGVITGTPTSVVNTTYTVTVTDATAATATYPLSIRTVAYVAPIPPYVEVIEVNEAIAFLFNWSAPDSMDVSEIIGIDFDWNVTDPIAFNNSIAINFSFDVVTSGGGGY